MATIDSRSSSSVTQLEFHQAMNDFKTMFPEMDEDVIECVLRSNNGAVDATIDQLLAMSSDSETEKTRTTSRPANLNQRNQLLSLDDEDYPIRPTTQTPPPSYNQAVPVSSLMDRDTLVGNLSTTTSSTVSSGVKVKNCNLERSYGAGTSSSATASSSSSGNILNRKVSNNSLRAKFKWNPPLVGHLPDSFLRFHPVDHYHDSRSRMNNDLSSHLSTALLQQKMHENELKRQQTRDDDPEVAQFLADERFAILLQNEEFVRELRHNQEFMSQLQLDAKARGQGSKGAAGGSSDASGQFSDAAFKEMLKNMSKMSRKKFAQVAGMFSRRKKKSFQQLLSDQESSSALTSSPNRQSKDHLLAREEEYGVLENDSSDSERDRDSPYWERPVPPPASSRAGSSSGRNPSSSTHDSFKRI